MKKRINILFLFMMTIPFYSQSQQLSEIIRGQQQLSRLDSVARFSDSSPYNYMPFSILKGKEPGPVFTIVAGVHGYEYPPLIAVQELLKEIDLQKLKGTIIVVPVANIASFYKRSPFVNPVDGKNLNTAFPGSATGSLTDQIAYWITKQLIPVSDVFLDIHGGDAGEDLEPFICYYNRKDAVEKTDMAHELSEVSGMRYIVSYPYTLTAKEPAKYAFKQAVQNGITALSIEAGKLGTVQEENVILIKEAVYKMIQHLKMYASPQTAKPQPLKTILTNQTYIRVQEKGFFYSNFKSGDTVSKGQQLGYITDEYGKLLQHISSPADGVILYKVGTPPVNKDETLFCIGH